MPLHGYLRTPANRKTDPDAFGADLVICNHGIARNFYERYFFDAIGTELLERGCAILRINNRGHDEAYQIGRRQLGAAYEVVDDCRLDTAAWLDFAERLGFRRIALWGHSLGAVKTIYVLSAQDDARVAYAIASSPPRFSHSMYVAAEGARFQKVLEQAQSLIAAGRPDSLVQAEFPVPQRFSARTYVDKYGPQARYDYFEHLPNVRKPLLLTLGSLEAENVSFAPLAAEGPGFSARWPLVDYRLIDGADHFYLARTGELWSAVSDWLQHAPAVASSL